MIESIQKGRSLNRLDLLISKSNINKYEIVNFPEISLNPPVEIDINTRQKELRKWDPLRCEPHQLRGHIANTHLSPAVAASYGVARFDIEVAAYRDIPLDWVVKKAYRFLEEDDRTIIFKMFEGRADYITAMFGEKSGPKYNYWSIPGYKGMIVKNLLYIEMLNRAEVDWQRVIRAFPEAMDVTLEVSDLDPEEKFNPLRSFLEAQIEDALTASSSSATLG
jgi:hypothetical protein